LAPALQAILDGMHARLAQTPHPRGGPLRDSLQDADYYLTVGQSLLSGQRAPTALGDPKTESAVTNALEAVRQLVFVMGFPIFGTYRMVDFSQFQIRGHYERSPGLGRYFQRLLW
jgi:Protein of unknown function (DUF3160)